MASTTIILKHYRPGSTLMDKELQAAEDMYNDYIKKNPSKKHPGCVTLEDVLERCFTGNHFGYLHLTKAQRGKLVKDAVGSLVKANVLSFSGGDFENLYDKVKGAIGALSGVGLLVLYDTTKMIGHILSPKVLPEKYVYTQSGAKVGAKTLLGVSRMGMRVPTSLLHPYFPKVSSIYIEDILCIYKKWFVKGGVSTKRGKLPYCPPLLPPTPTNPSCC